MSFKASAIPMNYRRNIREDHALTDESGRDCDGSMKAPSCLISTFFTRTDYYGGLYVSQPSTSRGIHKLTKKLKHSMTFTFPSKLREVRD